MAFQLRDFFRSYAIRGNMDVLLNVARSDESAESPRYYAFMNEEGSYIIQRVVVTAGVGVYTYYATSKQPTSLAADWTNRPGLAYVEYYLLFGQG